MKKNFVCCFTGVDKNKQLH